jgi:enoyl-CoA hydratase/carnithine racemase
MTGTGEKAFCAGGDIVSLYKAHIDPSKDQSIKRNFFEQEYLLDYSLSKMKPF